MSFFSPATGALLVGTIVIYWLLARTSAARRCLLSALSVSVLTLFHPALAVGAMAICLVVHAISAPGKGARLVGTLIGAVGLLLAGKYGTALWEAIGPRGWAERHVIVPLGLSYLAFRVIHFAVERYRGNFADASRRDLFTYLFFVPTLPAGPLETYRDFATRELRWDGALFHEGIRRLLLGYFKKLFVLELVLSTVLPRSPEAGATWSYVGMRFLEAYLDLSAYTDIALGWGALFGFRLVENFDAPLVSGNLARFWRSWHISLGRWCRDHVYFPVLGASRRPWLATYLSMIVMGLWHQLSANWLLWGMHHATGLIVVSRWERMKRRSPGLRRACDTLPARALATVLTLAFVVWGFSLVVRDDFSGAIRLYLACLK